MKDWHITKAKNGNLNGSISKARANSESKLTFSEGSFNFLKNKVLFVTLYSSGYRAVGSAPYIPRYLCQPLIGLEELIMSQ